MVPDVFGGGVVPSVPRMKADTKLSTVFAEVSRLLNPMMPAIQPVTEVPPLEIS